MEMLATARRHLPQLHALPMDRAVAEPVHAPELVSDGLHPHLSPQEAALAQHLRTLQKGRLEQEFLPAEEVAGAVRQWACLPLF